MGVVSEKQHAPLRSPRRAAAVAEGGGEAQGCGGVPGWGGGGGVGLILL